MNLLDLQQQLSNPNKANKDMQRAAHKAHAGMSGLDRPRKWKGIKLPKSDKVARAPMP